MHKTADASSKIGVESSSVEKTAKSVGSQSEDVAKSAGNVALQTTKAANIYKEVKTHLLSLVERRSQILDLLQKQIEKENAKE